jgi:glutaminyl-tRNA synthetase
MSKRKLLQLVQENLVSGWDDPRMPTMAGMRRRGYTPEAIRNFCETIGVTKYNSLTDMALLEHCVRDDLNKKAPRVLGVLRPLKVVIDNYPENQVDELDAVNNPEDPSAGTRKIQFSKVIYIEQDDFKENPPKDYFRLAPGKEVRFRYAYLATCTGVVKDPLTGQIIEIHCNYDPATRGGNTPDGRKVKGTIHWVSAKHAVNAEIRLYERLLTVADVGAEEGDFKSFLNQNSLETLENCKLERSLADAKPGSRFQFERQGYFSCDPDSEPGKPVFNRIVPLKDSWAKIEKGQKK